VGKRKVWGMEKNYGGTKIDWVLDIKGECLTKNKKKPILPKDEEKTFEKGKKKGAKPKRRRGVVCQL